MTMMMTQSIIAVVLLLAGLLDHKAEAFVIEKRPQQYKNQAISWRLEKDCDLLSQQRRCDPTSTTICNLFFRSTETTETKKKKKNVVSPQVLSDLSSANESLPYQIDLATSSSSSSSESIQDTTFGILTVRAINWNDVKSIVDICMDEYASGPVFFPWDNPKLLGKWVDRQGLRQLIDLTTRMKLVLSSTSSSNGDNDDYNDGGGFPNDHAVLVACFNNTIVGMVEVSQQPVIPERNPPPFPIPLLIKQAYARLLLKRRTTSTTSQQNCQGWITNLLIIPPYRGKGYSKLLVKACEGVAKAWNCQSIHLHCDADARSDDGRVAQKLYTSLGYRMLNQNSDTDDDTFSWMQESVQCSIFLIGGVPLLYLQKDLNEKTQD